jgi:transcription elongation factor Elf1
MKRCSHKEAAVVTYSVDVKGRIVAAIVCHACGKSKAGLVEPFDKQPRWIQRALVRRALETFDKDKEPKQ